MGVASEPWVLRAESITKAYGRTVALERVSLSVRAGEALAIMGPSGSGKTTLLHLLAGIVTPDEGSVLLRSVNQTESVDIGLLSDDDRSALRLRRFGFVFQQGLLIPELTANENIALPLLLTGTARREAAAQADHALTQLGLDGLGCRRIGQLSGGQAQRVAIARAMITAPQVVFADEPTGALDSAAAEDVLDRLLELNTEANRAVVIVTHDEDVAARCARTVRLHDGHIVASEKR